MRNRMQTTVVSITILSGKATLVFACIFLALAPAFAMGSKTTPPRLTVYMQNAQGINIGTATLSQAKNGLRISLDLQGLTPGVHAIHVHQISDCTPPDFKSAGGHFNPDRKQHGLGNPQGAHAGDIPNFTVDFNGKAKVTLIAPNLTLGDDPHSVFRGDGTALVIHANADDMMTDPAGNAGDRVACGEIKKSW